MEKRHLGRRCAENRARTRVGSEDTARVPPGSCDVRPRGQAWTALWEETDVPRGFLGPRGLCWNVLGNETATMDDPQANRCGWVPIDLCGALTFGVHVLSTPREMSPPLGNTKAFAACRLADAIGPQP